MQTKDLRDNISLLTMGPRPIIIPSVNNGIIIDYMAINHVLLSMAYTLRPKKDEKGHLFEDVLIAELTNSGIKLWECKKKLKHLDGSSKEIDVSFIHKGILFIAELKANGRSITYIEGNNQALNYRKGKIRDAIKQVESKADWILTHLKGTNYYVPENINIIIPFIVTPFVEYIWSDDPNLWFNSRTPRICTPNECCGLCTPEIENDILSKPFIRLVR